MRKYEVLQSSQSLGSEVQTELTKLQLIMEKVFISLEKVEVIKKHWGDKVLLQQTILLACTKHRINNIATVTAWLQLVIALIQKLEWLGSLWIL